MSHFQIFYTPIPLPTPQLYDLSAFLWLYPTLLWPYDEDYLGVVILSTRLD